MKIRAKRAIRERLRCLIWKQSPQSVALYLKIVQNRDFCMSKARFMIEIGHKYGKIEDILFFQPYISGIQIT